jgi:uncharacterized membrane protein YgcG
MKDFRIKVVLLLLLVAFTSVSTSASTVKQLDIRALLHPDGSASIEERWLIDLDDDDAKTEWYVAHRGLKDMRIRNLTVVGYVPGNEGLTPFETLDEWDVDASRKKKTGKCGLNNSGQEICWGFGDYGEHEYIVRYTLTHLVKSYDTCDGFNHCFVDMNCEVENATVTIEATDSIALSEANTRRWGFGYKGRIEFKGNSIVATPEETIGDGKRIIIMLEMDKGMFAPDTEGGEPWADKKQRALDGNDYDTDDDLTFWDWVCVIGFFLVVIIFYLLMNVMASLGLALLWLLLSVVWWVVSLSPLRTWRRRKKLGIGKGHYFRDVKKEWSMRENKMLVDDLSYCFGMNNERIIGALLLRLMSRGHITIVREKYKGKDCDMLKIVTPAHEIDKTAKGDNRLCSHVLRLLTLASGQDQILQPDEFKQWCKKKSNSTDIKNFLDLLDTKYDKQYINENAADLYGLKAFLNDFSLLNERSMMEVKLWDEYMVYAEFFGLSDKVRSEMKKICPEYLNMSRLAQSLEVAKDTDIVYMFSDSIYTSATNAVERAASQSKSSTFSGGFASFSSSGGGGGFSGGGGGGGR